MNKTKSTHGGGKRVQIHHLLIVFFLKVFCFSKKVSGCLTKDREKKQLWGTSSTEGSVLIDSQPRDLPLSH